MFGSSRAIGVAIGALLPSLAACLVPQLGLTPLRAVSASTNRIARASGSGEGFGYGAGYDPELTAALELVEVSCRAAHSSPLSALPPPLLTTPPVRRHESRQRTRHHSPHVTAAFGWQVGCRAARDLQSGIVEAKSSTAKADTSGTGFGVSPVTVADFTVQCLLLGALAQRFPNERSVVRTRRPRSGRAGHPSARGALPPAHGGSLSRKSRATASRAPQCSSPGGASPRRRSSRRLSRRVWACRTLTLGHLTLTLTLTLLQDDPS